MTTLIIDKKKYVAIPKSQYDKMIERLEELEDIQDVKKRSNEKTVSFEVVKKNFEKKWGQTIKATSKN